MKRILILSGGLIFVAWGICSAASASFFSKTYTFNEPAVAVSEGYSLVTLGNFPTLAGPGNPELPFRIIKVLLPPDIEGLGALDISVTAGTRTEKMLTAIVRPGPEVKLYTDPTPPQRIPNTAVYGSTQGFPGAVYAVHSVQRWHGMNILVLRLNPVVYFPAQNKLATYQTLTVAIAKKVIIASQAITGTTKAGLLPFRNLAQDNLQVLEAVENPSLIAQYAAQKQATASQIAPMSSQSLALVSAGPCDYLIITNLALKAEFDRLASYYNTYTTIKTKVVTVEDIDRLYPATSTTSNPPPKGNVFPEQIRNCIKDYYTNCGLQYVLLGGDTGDYGNDPVIPVYYQAGSYIDGPKGLVTTRTIPCDQFYAGLDGEGVDLTAEVQVGRAPVNTLNDTKNFVDKTIAFRNTRGSYMKNVYLLGEYLGTSYSWVSLVTLDLIAASLQTLDPFCAITKIYDFRVRDGIGKWGGQSVVDTINAQNNIQLVFHFGHSCPRKNMRFVNPAYPLSSGTDRSGSVTSFTNTNPFFAGSVGCYGGAFDGIDEMSAANTRPDGDCIGEDLITQQYGAVAYVGFGREGVGPYCATLFEHFGKYIDNTRAIGQVLQKSKVDLLDDWLPGSDVYTNVLFTVFGTNILGDPTLVIGPDASAPAKPVVTAAPYTRYRDRISATWKAFDNESGVTEYKYGITTTTTTEPATWTNVSTNSTTASGLSLAEGGRYYFAVKAKNSAGLWSETGYSGVVTVDSTLPFIGAPTTNYAGSFANGLEIKAQVSDPGSGVNYAYIYYQRNYISNGQYLWGPVISKPMSLAVSPYTYRVALTSAEVSGSYAVRYFITAWDKAGNSVTSSSYTLH